MIRFTRIINALVIWILIGVLLGAFFVQYYYQEEPCPLCLLQRFAMISVAVGFFLNLWFGIRVHHYAVSYFSAIFGTSVSIRQIMLHICPGDEPFGFPVFGFSLYTWAFIVFGCVIFGLSLLLFFYRPLEELNRPKKISWFYKLTCIAIFLVAIANLAVTFSLCGFGLCVD